MRSRPPDYFYFQGYLMVLAALWAFGLGIVRLDDWRYFGFGLAITAGATVFFAYLAWWRRSYEEWHPDDLGTPRPLLQRTADDLSTKFVRWLTRFARRDRSQRDLT